MQLETLTDRSTNTTKLQSEVVMSARAPSSPEQAVNTLFEALDRLDIEAIEALFDDEPQGVDELSGGWRRGRDALHDYFSQITSAGLADVRSTIADVHTKNWGDTAVVTLVVDQTYTLEGEQHAIHAPSTIVLRRVGDEWRVALVHSVPVGDRE
jgi:ketosteroid isomerase-like protein